MSNQKTDTKNETGIQRSQTTAIQRAAAFVEEARTKIVGNLPRGVDGEAFIRSAFLAFDASDDLKRALETPEGKSSVMSAMRLAACKGLSLNPQEGLAGFIPYSGRIEYRVYAAGLVALALRNGHVKEARTFVVYENDGIEIEQGDTGDTYRIRPAMKNRGDVSGFLAAVILHDGTKRVLYWTAEQAREWGSRFSRGKSPMWERSFEGAGQKTVLRQLLTKLHIAVDEFDVDDSTPAQSVEITVSPEKGASAEDLREKIEARNEARDERVILAEDRAKNGPDSADKAPF